MVLSSEAKASGLKIGRPFSSSPSDYVTSQSGLGTQELAISAIQYIEIASPVSPNKGLSELSIDLQVNQVR